MGRRSLYTNITNHKGIEVAKEVLNKQTEKPIATKVIVNFYIYFLLSTFLKGYSMATIGAPSHYKTPMSKFESDYM